jgi:hypothetical protein
MSKRKSSKEEGSSAINGGTIAIIVAIIGLLGTIIATILGPIIVKRATDTPTPVNTQSSQRRDWYVIFELKFPPNYWTEGLHSYLFDANCPFGINSTGENEPAYSFTVDPTTQIQTSIVYIRRGGLFLSEIQGDSLGNFIHPSQETAAIYSPFALAFEDAKQLKDECKVTIKIDNGTSMDLTPTSIDKLP